MLKIVNPYFKPAGQNSIEQKAATFAPQIQAWMQAQSGNRIISVSEIKTAFPALAPDLNRLLMNHIIAALGVDVVNPEDTDA